MRLLMLAVTAQLAWMHPACAETTPENDRSLRDALPLFEKNRCADIKDLAGQLFCGDPDLRDAGARLNVAMQDRINRIADRRMAIEENVEWIKGRSLSCGIFERQGLANQNIPSVKACLLKETEERIAILADPNFDCLATNTTAGILICGDPALAIADRELNALVVGLTSKMKDEEAQGAFAEYGRWTRERDRKCDLADKDNVPLQELSSSEACLADYSSRKTAEVVAAKGGVEQKSAVVLRLDSAPPPLNVIQPGDNSSTNQANIEVSGSSEPNATVSINNQNAPVDAQGNFATRIDLNEGSNLIEATATDRAGNATRVALTVRYVKAVAPPPTTTAPPTTTPPPPPATPGGRSLTYSAPVGTAINIDLKPYLTGPYDLNFLTFSNASGGTFSYTGNGVFRFSSGSAGTFTFTYSIAGAGNSNRSPTYSISINVA